MWSCGSKPIIYMCYDDPDKGHKPKVGIIIVHLIVRLVFSKLWNNVGFTHYFMSPVIGMVYGGPHKTTKILNKRQIT